MDEIESRDQKNDLLYKSMKGKKDAPEDGSNHENIKKRKEYLTYVF